MCNAERANAIGDFISLNICFQENNEPRVTEQGSSNKASLLTMEEAKNSSHFLVSAVVASNDNSLKLEEPEADVTPLCVRCRANEFVYTLAAAKILTDKIYSENR